MPWISNKRLTKIEKDIRDLHVKLYDAQAKVSAITHLLKPTPITEGPPRNYGMSRVTYNEIVNWFLDNHEFIPEVPRKPSYWRANPAPGVKPPESK